MSALFYFSDFSKMRSLLRKKRLPIPPVEVFEKRRIRELRDWVWGTRTEDYRLYDIAAYAEEAIQKNQEDYLLLGHDGYGTNTWFFQVLLKWKFVTVLVQAPWGGVYSSNQVALDGLQARIDLLQKFVQQVDQSLSEEKTIEGHLIVQQSSVSSPRWAWIEEGKPILWREEFANAMTPALDSLKNRLNGTGGFY